MRRNIFFNSIIFVFLVFIDQISKYLIRHTGGFYVCNPDLAFGINLPPIFFWMSWLFIIIVLVFKIFNQFSILKFSSSESFKENKKRLILNSLFFILILSGALSNIIDRLRFGCVIDFIDLKIWPVFNLADSYITIGAVIIIFSLLKKQKIS